jgi:cilia- and flagella-associated protein 69
MLIELLLVDAQYIAGGLRYHHLLVAAIDCVWCAVVGSVINEDEFIQKQGIFALLDLIEV